MQKYKLLFSIFFLLTNSMANTNFYNQGIEFLKTNQINQAIKAFKQASNNGNALAMYKLGVIYEETNTTKAIEWYEKAKKNGNTKAQYRLGVLSCKLKTYTHLKDFENYAKTYTKKSIQYDLAVCFEKSNNLKKARIWFEKVAKRGDKQAQYQMARLSSSTTEQINWLKKSANQSYALAEFELGKIFFKQHKINKAKKYLKRAKKHGSKQATIYLKRMKDLGL